MTGNAPPNTTTRRTFFGWLIGGLATLSSLMVGLPVIGSLLGPAFQRRKTEAWVDFGAIDALPLHEPRQLTATTQEKDGWYERPVQRAVWVTRTDATNCTVFHPRCTHLGCAYRWETEKRQFTCPCHGGTYDITGRVTGGPPPRSLVTLTAKVEAGKLYVRFI
jgi:menaquinol-cytochrome c reductase iron-sulfur subunit